MSEASNGHRAGAQLAPCGWFDVRVDGRSVVRVRGELDHATAPMLAAALEPITRYGGDVHIHLAALEFIDAAGINVLFAAARALGQRGRIAVCDPPAMTRRVIEITGLDQLVDLVDTKSCHEDHAESA